MFVDRPIGDSLKRKQLKWLLATFTAVMVVLVLVYVFTQNRAMDADTPVLVKTGGEAGAVSTKPTEADIQKQLEILAKEDAENPAPKPTEADIQKQLEALAVEDAKNPAPKPTQEEIAKQLEMLSKQ